MGNTATEVFRAYVPDIGFTLKVRANIEGKQSEYEKRVSEDKDADYRFVDYSANVSWQCSLSGDEQLIAANEKKLFKPVFFETKYFFRGSFDKDAPKKVKNITVINRLASVGDSFDFEDNILVGRLDFINEPGRFKLELKIDFENDTCQRVTFEFVVVSVKMNIMRDYDAILKTIEEARPHIAQSFLGKSFWGAALDGENKDDNKTWYQILSDVFNYYVNACKRIVNHPHQRYVRKQEYQRVDRIKRWSPLLANKFTQQSAGKQEHHLFLTERIEGAIDTPENRFVLYTLKALERRLREFANEQDSDNLVSKDWIKGVRDMADDLAKLSRNQFFKAVGRYEGFRQQSLIMQKQAGYAQILMVWLKLKRALKPGGDEIDAHYRPISTLYEFWCFLEMKRILAKTYGDIVVDEIESSTEEELLASPELNDGDEGGDKLGKIKVQFAPKDGVTCELIYQKTYTVREIGGSETESFSSLNPQRPDIVLTLKSKEGEFTYLFDAKYRIWSFDGDKDGTTRDAIDAMYRYRDAILYRIQKANIKREIIGAFVLYPGRPEPHIYERYKATISEEGIGAIPILPNFDGELVENLTQIINRHTSTEHLGKALSVRGTSVVIGEAFSEKDVLDINVDPGDWDGYIRMTREKNIKLGQEDLQGRDVTSIKYIRYRCANHLAFIIKVDGYSESNGVYEFTPLRTPNEQF